MLYYRVFILLFLTLLVSCKTKEEFILFPDSITFNMEDVEVNYMTERRKIDLNPLMDPEGILLHDTLLLISGRSTENENRIQVYNIADGRLLNSFAAIGRGPGEFLPVFYTQVLPVQNELFFYDLNNSWAVTFDLDSILSPTISSKELIGFRELEYLVLLKLDSLSYICRPFSLHNRHEGSREMRVMYSIKDNSVVRRAEFPPFERLSDSVLNRNHLGSVFGIPFSPMAYNETAEKIVLSFSGTDLLEIYDRDFNREVRIHGPHRFFPEFEFAGPRSLGSFHEERVTWPVARSFSDEVVFTPGVARYGYYAVYAVKNGFYVFYSGDLRKKPGDPNPISLMNLLFFNYQGELVSRYLFEKDYFYYAIDEKNGLIYLLGYDKEIYVYDIPR